MFRFAKLVLAASLLVFSAHYANAQISYSYGGYPPGSRLDPAVNVYLSRCTTTGCRPAGVSGCTGPGRNAVRSTSRSFARIVLLPSTSTSRSSAGVARTGIEPG
jgi:hypothetical protein